MLKRIALVALGLTLASAPAFAQKAEVGVTIGWVWADGVNSTNNIVVPGVGTFNRIDPKDSFGWGFDIGVFVGPNAEVGFQYTQQPTKLEVSGTTVVDIGDMSSHTYHGIFTYNFGEHDAKIRPYVYGGLGGTSYGDVSYQTINRTGTLSGFSRFSSTWGAGVKMYGASKVGGKFGLRWTPTYIKSDATGWWCDPYWGCYLVGNAQYANQVELNGGVTFRF
jgi:outer membrane protein with beta-barrel domain